MTSLRSFASICVWFVALATQTSLFCSAQVDSANPNSPVEARDSLKWMHVHPGYRLELVACEPQVVDPVDIAFGDDGSLWVVEMSDYPRGPSSPGERPKGRIRKLHDRDQDGFFETSHVFADGLLFPTGIQLWRDGALVTVAGQLLFLQDTNADGTADTTSVWADGFAQENSQLRANHPTWAWNQWLYVANGLRGGEIALLHEGRDASTKLQLAGFDLRMDPKAKRSELITGAAQFGLTFDDAGRRYICSNRNPCIEVLIEQQDVARSPLAGLSQLIADSVPAGEQSQVRPLTQAWTTSNLHAGQFTAACGVLATNSRHLPQSDNGHVLVCEPTGSLVHHRALKRVAGRTVPSDAMPAHEFIASRDPWFRPVNLKLGPDDAVYIVDMYRAVIEHPDWVPAELQHRPDERFGDDRGRIYRLVQSTTAESENQNNAFHELARTPISALSASDQAKKVDHPHAWHRETASRLLYHANLPSDAVPILKTICTQGTSRDGKLRAASLLDRFGQLDQATWNALLADPDPAVQAAVWRERLGLLADEPVTVDAKQFEQAFSDFDTGLHACWALADSRSESLHHLWHANRTAIDAVLFDFLADHAQDGRVWMALSAVYRDQLALLFREASHRCIDRYASETPESLSQMNGIWTAMERLAKLLPVESAPNERSSTRDEVRQMVAATRDALAEPKQKAFEIRWRLACLQGLLQGPFQSDIRSEADFWNQLAEVCQSHNADRELQLPAIRLFAWADSEVATKLCSQLVQNDDLVIARAALASWSMHDSERLTAELIERMPSAGPQDRVEFFQLLTANDKRIAAMLDAIESGRWSLRILDASQAERLRSIPNPELAKRIQKLLEKSIQADRTAVLERYKPCLELTPNLERGKLLFVKHCSACHRIGQDGYVVGPDISDSRIYLPSQLLLSILDPNRAIDNNYFRYVAATQDGQVVEGVMVESTAKTVTLRGQNAKVTTLNRDEIAHLKATGVSLMPEGIEAQIAIEEMADLIGYIKNWRYMDGAVPKEIIPK
jgi:putative membrane-bound dehydrogenase-like protein